MAGFWSDEDGAAYAHHWRELRRRDKGRRGGQRTATQRTRHVMHYNAASHAFIRRKVLQGLCVFFPDSSFRASTTTTVLCLVTQYYLSILPQVKVMDEDAILQLRIPPPPLPLAWARTVMPYVPKHLYGKSAQHVPTVRGDEAATDDGVAAPASDRHVVPDIAAVQVCNDHSSVGVGVWYHLHHA